MNVQLLRNTRDAESVCAAAALSCNLSYPAEDVVLNSEKVNAILKQIIKSGHHSILEHVVYTFSVSEVSRVLTHQLVRHRMASYTQQSQRCIKLDIPSFITPPSIETSVNDQWQQENLDMFHFAMNTAWETYNNLIEKGIPEEDARYVLPGACNTNIVITMNARELFHFFELRMCMKAQWEIRELSNRMYNICMAENFEIFQYAGPKCWTSKCNETKPCGHPPTGPNIHIS